MLFLLVFFFKHKTAYEMRISDWSSDVCSSDLRDIEAVVQQAGLRLDLLGQGARALPRPVDEFQHRQIEAVDILGAVAATGIALIAEDILQGQEIRDLKLGSVDDPDLDRKSTRLNSSH